MLLKNRWMHVALQLLVRLTAVQQMPVGRYLTNSLHDIN